MYINKTDRDLIYKAKKLPDPKQDQTALIFSDIIYITVADDRKMLPN